MIKLGHMVLKGVNWVHSTKKQVTWCSKESIGYTMIKLGEMVLKGVKWVHNTKISSYDLEESQFSTE